MKAATIYEDGFFVKKKIEINMNINEPGKIKAHLTFCAGKMSISLTEKQLELMEKHAAELLAWNKKINLTAIKIPEEVAEKHFADCIAAVGLFEDGQNVLDVGAGGGFPGIVLKVMNPSLNIWMVDASRKKVNFLKHVIRTLGLKGIDAVHARVEDLGVDEAYAGRFDAVVSRAFSELSMFVKLAHPFLKPDGWIHAMKGSRAPEELNRSGLSGYDYKILSYMLPVQRSGRHIISLAAKA